MSHRWIRAEYGVDRRRALAASTDGDVLATLDAHANLRGPYTLGGALLRLIVPAVDSEPLVRRHGIEILSLAPELEAILPSVHQTLTSVAVPEERTRFYSRLRTLRLAHGVVEFLTGYLRERGGPTAHLLIDNAHHADPTDRELIAVLLRRMDPDLLTLHVATGIAPLRDPAGPIAVPLEPALHLYASAVDQPTTGSPTRDGDLARAWIRSDGTDDDPAARDAYHALDAATRARLHDERADELADDDFSWRLGAIPFHRERGSDPAVAGGAALRTGLDYCINMGFYHATVDFGVRGRATVDWDRQPDDWWAFTTKMTTSLAALGRPEESAELYDEARAYTDNPMVHMQSAYATSMLYTRHLDASKRDQRLARAWSNAAIGYAQWIPDPEMRAFQTAFHHNGLALIAVHEGKLDEALRLVSEGIVRLDKELGRTAHALHRSVLRHNRSQVYIALGRRGEALEDLDAVIEDDPNYAEYHLDRGNLLRQLGRPEDALASYDTALLLSPPFPEVYYNRADTWLELGNVDNALTDFGYVLELDPDYVDAYVNRAGLRYEIGDIEGARDDVVRGLALVPGHAHLLSVQGQIELEDDPGAAHTTLSAALAAAPDLAAAWAARGAASYQLGDIPAALADLDRSIALGDDPSARYNRGVILDALGRHEDAAIDFAAAGEG